MIMIILVQEPIQVTVVYRDTIHFNALARVHTYEILVQMHMEKTNSERAALYVHLHVLQVDARHVRVGRR